MEIRHRFILCYGICEICKRINPFSNKHVLFLCQGDKARFLIGLAVSRKQDVMMMHLEYKLSMTDHDFPIGESHKLKLSVYAYHSCHKDSEKIGYSGHTNIGIQSAKHGKICAASHKQDLERIVRYYFKYSQ